MANRTTLAGLLTLFSIYSAFALSPLDQYLLKSNEMLVSKSVQLLYTETYNQYEHSFTPFEYVRYLKAGRISIAIDAWHSFDTITVGPQRSYSGQSSFTPDGLSKIKYGDTSVLDSVTLEQYYQYLMATARYSPHFLIEYVASNCEISSLESAYEDIIISRLGETEIYCFINRSKVTIDSIVTREHDPLYGDNRSCYRYKYLSDPTITFWPEEIYISKFNKAMEDSVHCRVMPLDPAAIGAYPKQLTRIKKDQQARPDLHWSTHASGLHLLELRHTDDRVLVVEFEEFVLVAEAPLNSGNGHLIIDEIQRRIGKPIKYFVYGHFHPHYLGGVRAFVNTGAKIISSQPSSEYVRFLVENEHSIQPDSLYHSQRPLQQIVVSDSLTLSDDSMEMIIYFIGGESAHTCDYMIYYFPRLKILFEDDLVWIPNDGPTQKAGSRQLGLYNAIEKRNLKVDTIIQSWPVQDYGVKTIFSYEELRVTVQMH